MLFITYDPYIDNIDNIAYSECFICFEIKNKNEFPIKLYNQRNYMKICKCDGWIHKSCLDCWYNINNYNCPICRKYTIPKKSISCIVTSGNNIISCVYNYYCILNMLYKKFIFSISYLFIFYFVFNIYFTVLNYKYHLHDYECNNISN